MVTRCVKCNKYHDFRNRRGAKLNELTCKCGGWFERLLFDHYDFDNLPIYKNKEGKEFLVVFWDQQTKTRIDPYITELTITKNP